MKNYLYILTHSSGNLTCEYNPINWDSFNIVFKRSETYHSVLRNQIIDVEFPFDGKEYIDTIYQTYGIDTEIGCEIQYLNKSTLAYATLLTGIIDLSEYVRTRDKTSVKIIDSTKLAKFAARDKMQLSLNASETIEGTSLISPFYAALINTLTIEGVTAELNAQYDHTDNAIAVTALKTGGTSWAEYYGVTNDDYDYNEVGTDATLPAVTLGGASGPIYTNNKAFALTVRLKIGVRVIGQGGGFVGAVITASNTWSLRIRCFIDSGVPNALIDIQDSGSGNDTTVMNTSYESGYLTATVAPGGTIDVYQLWEGLITGPGDTIAPDFEIQPYLIDLFEVYDAIPNTDVSVPLVHETTAKLLSIMVDDLNPLNAPLLGRTDSDPRSYGSDGDYSLIAIANGLMIRGFPFADAPLTTSFEDLFKSLDACFNLGMHYDATADEFVIAAKEDYYKVTKIIDLGEVQELEISVATDHYFNKVLGGYMKPVSYEQSSGIQAIHVPVEFINRGHRVQNELDLRCVYRADDQGIEFARQSQYEETAGEDTRYDNDIFMIMSQRNAGDYITLQGLDNFTVIEGVYSPYYRLNIDITPVRNLLRNTNRLSIPGFISNDDFQFSKSQYNVPLETKKAAEAANIEEIGDIAYADLDEPLYYPELYNFKAELSVANILQLFSDPHGYVEIDFLGVTYSGYILEVSSEPFNRKGNWTLLKRNPNRV